MVIKLKAMEPERAEKLQAILQDEEFVVSILDKSPEEARAAFESKGLFMTLEEVEELGTAIQNANSESQVLSENDLENVTGGGVFTLFEVEWKITSKWKLTVKIPW